MYCEFCGYGPECSVCGRGSRVQADALALARRVEFFQRFAATATAQRMAECEQWADDRLWPETAAADPADAAPWLRVAWGLEHEIDANGNSTPVYPGMFAVLYLWTGKEWAEIDRLTGLIGGPEGEYSRCVCAALFQTAKEMENKKIPA